MNWQFIVLLSVSIPLAAIFLTLFILLARKEYNDEIVKPLVVAMWVFIALFVLVWPMWTSTWN